MSIQNLNTERELLEQIASGNEIAFAILFRTVMPQLEPAVRKLVHSEEGMKDVIQETFIRVWMSRDTLPGLDKPLSWLFRVASNECFTWLRKQALRERHLQAVSSNENEVAPFTAADTLDLQETSLLIHKAVQQLPESKRRIYLMSREQGMKTADIASELNLSHSHVKNTLSSSLQFIREYLVASGKVLPLLWLFLK